MAKKISAAEAMKAFKGKSITVQTARQVEKDVDGEKKKVTETKDVPLSDKLITGAAQHDDGRVVITTIDGKKHEVEAAAA